MRKLLKAVWLWMYSTILFAFLCTIWGMCAHAQSLMHIKSWAYQLDSLNISDIANNETFELMVMDYSQDGTIDGEFTSSQINQIKSSGKLAIAYI